MGYYYRFNGGGVKLIKYLLEENGFKDSSKDVNTTVIRRIRIGRYIGRRV